jgi:DNA-binding LytR/AlgR family response regulator
MGLGMPLRVVIVDDEPPARRDLRRMLEGADDVAVVGEADTIDAARSVIASSQPDAVFLDLRLGGHTGFELMPAVPAGVAVVIVTAYDEYALRAFETNALDYLLKPVEAARLSLALARIRSRPRADAARPADGRIALPDRVAANDWLLLRDGGREEFVRTSSIACITAEGDYSRVATVDGRARLIHRSLRDWESRLPSDAFERLHRSALVNLRHIVAIERKGFGHTVTLRGQPPIAISRRAATRIRRTRV